MCEFVTKEQLKILYHALGINLLKPNDPPGWRNYYSTGPGCNTWADVQQMVAGGFMVQSSPVIGDLEVFIVTTKGWQFLGFEGEVPR